MDSNNEFSDENKRNFVPEAKVAPHFVISFHGIEHCLDNLVVVVYT